MTLRDYFMQLPEIFLSVFPTRYNFPWLYSIADWSLLNDYHEYPKSLSREIYFMAYNGYVVY